MPGVLLRALSEYKFVGTPLWRMSDGKDLVRVELTFHKALPRDDEEINVDLPVYFVYHRDKKHWTLMKGPTSKFYNVDWYEYIEQFYKRDTKQRNSILVRSWRNPAVTPYAEVEDHHIFAWCRQATLAWLTLSMSNLRHTDGWGHPIGSGVRTPSRHLGQDTLSAPGWGHPLGSWVRTPTLHPFRRPIDRHVASERILLSTRAVCLMHYVVGIDTH